MRSLTESASIWADIEDMVRTGLDEGYSIDVWGIGTPTVHVIVSPSGALTNRPQVPYTFLPLSAYPVSKCHSMVLLYGLMQIYRLRYAPCSGLL